MINNNGDKIIPGIGKPVKRTFFKKKKVKSKKNIKEAKSGGKCKNCTSSYSVSVHHILFGQGKKDDSIDNLIALCFKCHRKAHDGFYYEKKEKKIFVSPRDFMLEVLERINPKKYEQAIIKLNRKKK